MNEQILVSDSNITVTNTDNLAIYNNLVIYNLYYGDICIGNCAVRRIKKIMNKVTDAIEIANLFINSNYREQGFGTFLLRNIIQDAFNRGFSHMVLVDISKNQGKANNIYKKIGFSQIDFQNPRILRINIRHYCSQSKK